MQLDGLKADGKNARVEVKIHSIALTKEELQRSLDILISTEPGMASKFNKITINAKINGRWETVDKII